MPKGQSQQEGSDRSLEDSGQEHGGGGAIRRSAVIVESTGEVEDIRVGGLLAGKLDHAAHLEHQVIVALGPKDRVEHLCYIALERPLVVPDV
jgi:hypothetical protein